MNKKNITEYVIIGYTTSSGVLLDLDHTTLHQTKKLAHNLLYTFKLEGYYIIESSPECYHVVFNKRFTNFSKVTKIVAHACLWSKSRGLSGWLLFQLVKQSLTIRITSKGEKHPPKIMLTHGKTDGICKEYHEIYNHFNKKQNI